MKRILIPTDFSAYAERAIDVGVKIAKRTNAEVYLFHSVEYPHGWKNAFKNEQEYQLLCQHEFEKRSKELTQIKKDIQAEGLKVYSDIFEGKFLKNISYQANIIQPDLIVMGSHGASGKEELLIGSNTQKVIRKLHFQVLAVKEKIENLNFKKALFVTGLDEKDKAAFKRFLEFIKVLEVEEVHIMTVNTTGFFSQPSLLMHESFKDFKSLATEHNVFAHFYSDYSIEAGIRHFSEDFGIGLIGISNKVRHPLKRIFLGSNVEMLVNHSKIPVVSIDY